jgi:hypothetical protein
MARLYRKLWKIRERTESEPASVQGPVSAASVKTSPRSEPGQVLSNVLLCCAQKLI